MRISDLIHDLEYELLCGKLNNTVSEVVYDTRKITEGCLFVCIKGANFNPHTQLDEIILKNPSCIVVSEEVTIPDATKTAIIKVKDSRYALAVIAAAYFNNPAGKLITIGITGTKGKTTTTYLVKSILEKAGYRVGLIGTIETIIGDEHIPSVNTTPESYLLQSYFAKMVEKGIQAVVMEVSSQGLMMNRVAGFEFDMGIFTNIEPDHIGPNEHKDFEDYKRCKAMLFDMCKTAIINIDDPNATDMVADKKCNVVSFGLQNEADIKAENISLYTQKGILGVGFLCNYCGEEFDIKVSSPGKFSVYNALTAIAVCKQLKVSNDNIAAALKEAFVKGRIELIKVSDDYSLMIDYAHNAMALESLLTTLREYEPNRLICLFGCGGNRSRDRRFEMGQVSGRLADLTIITSDNPRYEEPLEIIADIKTGIEKTSGKYVEIPDRKEAIRYAINNALPGDIVVLAGKGHEDYQEIKGVKYPMDERVLIREILQEQ